MKAATRLAVLAIGVCIAAGALAQGYPSKPVRVIVPFPKDGGVDFIARPLSQKLSELWGQPVVVENHAGGGGIRGTEMAAKSPPDGYTLLVHSYVYTWSPAFNTNLPYDALRDFVDISPLVSSPYVLVVGASAGVNTVSELIAAAKAKPGRVSSGFAFGVGSASHITGEKFRLATGIELVHVPMKDTRETILETLAGRITFSFQPLAAVDSLVRQGRLLALGVSSARRSSLLPDVPTLAEAGVAGFDATAWYGVWAPSGTPADVVDRLAKDFARALAAPDVRGLLAKAGLEPMSMTTAEFARFVRSEIESTAQIVKALGITPQVGPTGAPAVGLPAGGARPVWQQEMDRARRQAAAGNAYVLRGPSIGVLTMYNNPGPFCYMYRIPGDWVEAGEPALYRSKDYRAFAGVLFLLARSLADMDGATLVERARTSATRTHEKALGKPLTGVEWVPFESARPGTWKWTVAPVTQGQITTVFPTKIIVDLGPEAVVQITVGGTPDDDGLARRIIESLKTTSDPQCYLAVLERELKSTYGDR